MASHGHRTDYQQDIRKGSRAANGNTMRSAFDTVLQDKKLPMCGVKGQIQKQRRASHEGRQDAQRQLSPVVTSRAMSSTASRKAAQTGPPPGSAAGSRSRTASGRNGGSPDPPADHAGYRHAGGGQQRGAQDHHPDAVPRVFTPMDWASSSPHRQQVHPPRRRNSGGSPTATGMDRKRTSSALMELRRP